MVRCALRLIVTLMLTVIVAAWGLLSLLRACPLVRTRTKGQ